MTRPVASSARPVPPPLAVGESDAALMVGVSVSHLRKAVDNGALPPPRDLAGRKIYLVEDLARWLAALPGWDAAPVDNAWDGASP